MNKILYIHGLGGSSNSETAKYIQKCLGDDFIVNCPNIPENPVQAYKLLQSEEIRDCDLVVGSSLGGFYALCMSYPLKRIVINPAMHPAKYIKEKLTDVNISNDVLDKLEKLEKKLYNGWLDDENLDEITCFVSKNDSLLGIENFDACENKLINVNEIFCDHEIDHESIDKFIIPKILELIN